MSHEHCTTTRKVTYTINGLKYGKGDGSSELLSDHLLYACDNLAVVLSVLFTMMSRHGIAPAGMLIGTMVPIPKGRWNKIGLSDNYRAINLNSIFGKILDMVILSREENHLLTSNLQFSLKKGASTSI